jgi:signal transduction histidine kinase
MRYFLLFLCLHPTLIWGQIIDSLQRQLVGAVGSNRIVLQNELCYQLMYNNPKQAIFYGQEALKAALQQEDSLLLAQTYNDLSMPYLITGNFDSVILLNQNSYAIRMRNLQPGLAAANLSKIGQAYYEMGEYKKSILNQSRAYYILLATKDSIRLIQISNNLGVLFEKNSVFDLAKKWYIQSESLAKELGDERSYYIARINQAILARKTGDFVYSESLFEECKPYMETKGTINERAKFYEAFGVLFRSTGRNKQGINLYIKALNACQLLGDEVGLANLYRNLGLCYLDLNQVDKAKENLEKALGFATKNNLQDQVQTLLYDLYEWHKKKGDTKAALTYLEKHQASKNLVYNTQTQALIIDYSTRYKVEQHKNIVLTKEKELLSTQVKLKTNRQLLQLSISIILLVSFSLFWFYYHTKQKKLVLIQENKLAMNEERIRISRDLHDNLGADLTWIASELDLMAYAATQNNTQIKLSELADKMRLGMRSLRETIWAIHQEESSIDQVLQRLQESAKAALQQANINFTYALPNSTFYLSPAQTLHLYRLLKEALNNSVKHAKCKHIEVKLIENVKNVLLRYTDDGIGFPKEENLRLGYGLNNIKERAKLAGFTLHMEASAGYILEIQIPIKVQKQIQV